MINASMLSKKKLTTLYGKNLQFENKKVRTANLNPILNEIASINKEL